MYAFSRLLSLFSKESFYRFISLHPLLNMSDILKFLTLIGKLKATKRTGWVQNGVQSPESVSDHMYRMSIICFLVGGIKSKSEGTNLNKDHCIKLALAHDMAECIVGDLTPSDNVSKDEKHRREQDAMKRLADLAGEDVGKELYDLWEEYEAQKTPEANFIKDVDRFEMVLQAHEYEREANRPGWLQNFFDGTNGKFQHPLVKGWVNELNEIRNGY